MGNLAEAARRYWQRRDVIDALSRRITGACCTNTADGKTCLDRCYPEYAAYWYAPPSRRETWCPACRERALLVVQRSAQKIRLGGLMRAMRAAYLREVSK